MTLRDEVHIETSSYKLRQSCLKMSGASNEFERQRIISQIVNPSGSDEADNMLSQLGLAGMPPIEHVYRDIEEKLLLPKDKLPDHWLSNYQM